MISERPRPMSLSMRLSSRLGKTGAKTGQCIFSGKNGTVYILAGPPHGRRPLYAGRYLELNPDHVVVCAGIEWAGKKRDSEIYTVPIFRCPHFSMRAFDYRLALRHHWM